MTEPVVICWSGGKDCVRALAEVRRQPELEVVALLVTCSAAYDRVSMHGVRRALIEDQTDALGLPCRPVFVATPPKDAACPVTTACPVRDFTAFPTNDEYELRMAEAFTQFRAEGVRRIVFGDIFLADLRAYRDRFLAGLGMSGLYPLWQRDSRQLAEEFIAQGWRARTVCVDTRVLGSAWVGRSYDGEFLRDLPPGVDPCGENGEFHTFVSDGPMFRRPVRCQSGEVVVRDGFCFGDLLPARE